VTIPVFMNEGKFQVYNGIANMMKKVAELK
jgi:hypothetical protein